MKRYLFLFVLILIIGLASNAQAIPFTFGPLSDRGGTGTATMDIIIEGDTLTAVIDNTSPITLDDGTGINSPGITAFGFDFESLDSNILSMLIWELTAFTESGDPVTIGGNDPDSDPRSTDDWILTTDGNTSGIKLDYVPNTEQAVQGALYNPMIGGGEGAFPNFYTQAILTIEFSQDITLNITEDSPIIRMQNVGLNGEGSLKLPGKVPEPSTMLLLGFGLVGLAAVGRKKFHTS